MSDAPERIRIKRDDDVPIEFNNTSMTDVIFILLIFFISLSQIRTSQVDVNLPKVGAKSEGKADDGKRIIIEVSKENGIFVDGKKVEEGGLAAAIAALRTPGGEEPRVRIRSDDESKSGLLVQVIAALAEAGITKVEFAVKVQAG
jgi:biopolymer transport protein ExbD